MINGLTGNEALSKAVKDNKPYHISKINQGKYKRKLEDTFCMLQEDKLPLKRAVLPFIFYWISEI